MITAQQRGETRLAYLLRRFNTACKRMSHCNTLQAMRRDEGMIGAAYFYQMEARRAYQVMADAKASYDAYIAEFIPGTVVRWDDIFPSPIDKLWQPIYAQMAGRGRRATATLPDYPKDEIVYEPFRSPRSIYVHGLTMKDGQTVKRGDIYEVKLDTDGYATGFTIREPDRHICQYCGEQHRAEIGCPSYIEFQRNQKRATDRPVHGGYPIEQKLDATKRWLLDRPMQVIEVYGNPQPSKYADRPVHGGYIPFHNPDIPKKVTASADANLNDIAEALKAHGLSIERKP